MMGSIAVFAFRGKHGQDAEFCSVWVCATLDEEQIVEDRFGPVEPGEYVFSGKADGDQLPSRKTSRCRVAPSDVPAKWLSEFPDTAELVDSAAQRLAPTVGRLSVDQRLIRRRSCEYELFRSIEDACVLPRLREGFGAVEIFMSFANAIATRRRSRSGNSLQLHLKKIFEEERMAHTYNKTSEGWRRPDFLFPPSDAYDDAGSGTGPLRVLAVKTTCKNRWRQMLGQADQIPVKHLLTLQEGVSESQHREMQQSGVVLVVPSPLIKKYPASVRTHLLSLSSFIQSTRNLYRQ
jgi:hypothetical protein